MPATSACPDANDLQEFAVGKLSDPQAEALARHLAQCPRCLETLHGLKVDDTLVEAVRSQARIARQPDHPVLKDLISRLSKLRAASPGVTASAEATQAGNHGEDDVQPIDFLAPSQGPDELGRLGFYRILKVLGRGGMGVVFQAEDTHLKRAVAVKAMLPEVARKTTARERFLREARAAAALEHDHIVTIYHVGEEGGVPYLVMPLLKGASLEDFLRRKQDPGKPGVSAPGGLSVGQLLKVGREIAKGLAAAHAVGLIHRDIKPANIWLDATAGGRVKILDFGLARATTDDAHLTTPGLVVGTPSYMAPEQGQGKPVDGRTDLYSLGCVLYRLGTGRVPFQGADAVSTLIKSATEEPTPLEELNPELPPGLCKLVRRLLAKNPLDRPPSAQAVVEDIQRLERNLASADGPRVAEDQTRNLLQLPRPASRRRRLWAVLAAALVLVGGVYLAQLIIRITDKDGKVQEVAVPPGAKVEIVHKETDLGFEQWLKDTQQLPAEKQVEEVKKKLTELNPRFDGKMTHKSEGTVVTELAFSTFEVSNIAPVKALAGLKKLSCIGNYKDGRGLLADLSPLVGLPLVSLRFQYNRVSDLSPLRGMALTHLDCGYNNLTDLSVIQNMPLTDLRCGGGKIRSLAFLAGKSLTYFNCNNTLVSDLSPLRGMPLTGVGFVNCPVSDLSPLKGMALTYLNCHGSKVVDLGILKDMPLRELGCNYNPERDGALLASIKTLEKINDQAKNQFLKQATPANAAFEQWLEDTKKLPAEKQVEAVAKKLVELNPGFDGKVVYDLEAVANGFRRIRLCTDMVSDISPLQALSGIPRLHLHIDGSAAGKGRLADLKPLRGLQLGLLVASQNPITDVTPLQDLPLEQLFINETQVADLTPLLRIRTLWDLHVSSNRPLDLPTIRQLPLRSIHLRHHEVEAPELKALLCSMPTLEWINNQRAIDFWKKVDPTHAAFLQWIEDTKKLPAEQQVEAVARKLVELNPGFDGKLTPKIMSGAVTELKLNTDAVRNLSPLRALSKLRKLAVNGTITQTERLGQLADLSPLRGLRLEYFECHFNRQVTDLSPLQGMPLLRLDIHDCGVKDLSPLKGLPLTSLWIGGNPATDLSPLKELRLREFSCYTAPLSDLSPLQGMPLIYLDIRWTKVVDLSPLKDAPLREVEMEHQPARDAILRSIKTLEKINNKPPSEFWKQSDPQYAAFLEWIEDTKKLPAEKQVEAVAQKLVELNPGFDGKVKHTIEKGTVHDLAFNTDNVADLEPLRALPQLRRLFCAGHWPCKGKVRDLSPVRSLRQLYLLECNHNPVEDLAPLQGLPIKYLRVDNGVFRSLKPLEGMPLINLCVAACPNVSDLSPLRGMRLGRLACNVTAVSDLSPLQDMPLWYVDCRNTRVTDVSVAKTWTALKELNLDFKPERDTELLRSIKTLEKINDKLVAGFLKPAATNAAFEQWLKDTQNLTPEKQAEAVAKKLQELNPGFDGKVEPNIVDGKVAGLSFSSVEVSDLAPLRALPELRTLDCSGTPDQQGKLSDLSPLTALTRLDKLTISRTAVADLTPLRKLPLSFLHCYEILVEDLSPVKNMPLQKIGCDPDLAQSNRATLQAVKSLQTINNKPAAVFWKEVNAKKP